MSTPTDKNDPSKHPETIVVDRTDPAARPHVGEDASASYADQSRQEGDTLYQQRDIYPYAERENSRFASLDLVNRPTVVGSLYFEVDESTLAKADSDPSRVKTKGGAHDGAAYTKQLAENIVGILTNPNEHMNIAIVGHASKTGTAEHNKTLSDERADAESLALKENIRVIARARNLDADALLARLEEDKEGKGDTELAVKTPAETPENRPVTVYAFPQNDGRVYRVVHLAQSDIDTIQKGDNSFTLDLSMKTDIGKIIHDAFSKQVPQPARGSIVLETTNLTKPLDVTVDVNQADDVRFLVKDASNVHYVMTSYHDVAVYAGDAHVANLHYKMDGGQLLSPSLIHVGTVDAEGHTQRGSGTVQMETLAKALVARMDTDHDGRITQAEIEAYKTASTKMSNTLKGADHADYRTSYSKMLTDPDGAILKTDDNAFRDISGVLTLDQVAAVAGKRESNGEFTISSADMKEFREEYALSQLLTNFKLPKSGAMNAEDVANQLAGDLPSAPLGKPVASAEKNTNKR